jgi:cell division protein ZapA
MKQVEVQIMGQGYILGCPEDEEQRLYDSVKKVDEAMCRIRDAGKIKARERIAVLAALNLAFDASAAVVAEPAAAASNDTAGQALEQQMPQLQDLLQRLDQALGVDGQLL